MQADATDKPVTLNGDVEFQARSPRQLVVRRFLRHRMAVVGMFILLGIILYIVIGSIILSEHDANFNDLTIRLNAPTNEYPFGTDTVGRDILARTIYGGQISLLIGLSSMIVAVSIGTLIGIYVADIVSGSRTSLTNFR